MYDSAATVKQNTSPAAAEDAKTPHEESPRQYLYRESLDRLPIQPKLALGAVDDPLEAEADAMADRVMRMPETLLQRKCSQCEEEENLQRKPSPDSVPFLLLKQNDEGFIYAKSDSASYGGRIERQSEAVNETRAEIDASGIKAQPTNAFLQFKLTVGAANDTFEREADAVADKVLQMQEGDLRYSPGVIREKCAGCDAEEKQGIQLKEFQTDASITARKAERDSNPRQAESPPLAGVDRAPARTPTAMTSSLRSLDAEGEKLRLKEDQEEELGEISLKSFGGGSGEAPEDVASKLEQSKGSGNRLPGDVRAFMEQSIGADFSGVKIHTDGNAVQLSKDLNAQAFTHGNDIFFNSGKYNPGSSEGKHLLAHELTHTIQQGATDISFPPSRSPTAPSDAAVLQPRKIMRVAASGTSNLLQRAPNEEKLVPYQVTVPKGITTEQQLDRYAEVLIFGKALNLNWPFLGWEVRPGKTFTYRYPASFVKEHGGKKPEEAGRPASSNPAYARTKGEERAAINEEIDKRYREGTGTNKGEKIEKGEQAKIDMWNVYRDEVMNEKKELGAIPAELKELMGGESNFKPQDYRQLLRIAEKLKTFTPEDLAVYKMLALRATDNLDLFEKSVDMFLARKEELKEAFKKYEEQNKDKVPHTMQDAIEASWKGFDSSKIGKLSASEQYDLARQQTWEVTKAQLEYMKNHPGETAIDFAKTATLMNSGETFSGIGKDIAEAAKGDANAWARWAGGVGAGAKLSGWLLAVGGVLYVLSWLTGVGELATIAAFMGAMLASTIVLSTAESELRIKAASQAKTPEEFKEQVTKAAAARTNVIIMIGLLALALAVRFVAKTFFPETVAKISKSLARFREKVRIAGKLSDVKTEFVAEMEGYKQKLIEAGKSAQESSKAQADALDKMSLEEFVEKLDNGKGDFFQEAAVQEGQKIPWKELAKTPEGLKAIEAYKAQLADALRNTVPKGIDGMVKEQTDAIDGMLENAKKATVSDEFEQAIKDHEKFLSEEEVAKRGKAREEEMRKEKAEEALKEIEAEMKKAEEAKNAAKSYPQSWEKFTSEHHAEFEAELNKFRGDPNLEPDPNLKGGEGWLFTSKLQPLQALKRWFKARVSDMPQSVLKLKQAKQVVEANSDLATEMEVVEVHKVGSDWVLRDFDAKTIPLKDAMKSSTSAKEAQARALAAIEKGFEGIANAAKKRRLAEIESGNKLGKEFYTLEEKAQNATLKDIKSKLAQEPANENLHWSGAKKKIVIIDMQ